MEEYFMLVTKATRLRKKQKNHSNKKISKIQLSRGKKKGKRLGLRKILKKLREQYFLACKTVLVKLLIMRKKCILSNIFAIAI